MTLTQAEKQRLEDAASDSGTKIWHLAYNPVTTVGDPEGDAIASGKIQFKREASATLVEVIYTSAVVP